MASSIQEKTYMLAIAHEAREAVTRSLLKPSSVIQTVLKSTGESFALAGNAAQTVEGVADAAWTVSKTSIGKFLPAFGVITGGVELLSGVEKTKKVFSGIVNPQDAFCSTASVVGGGISTVAGVACLASEVIEKTSTLAQIAAPIASFGFAITGGITTVVSLVRFWKKHGFYQDWKDFLKTLPQGEDSHYEYLKKIIEKFRSMVYLTEEEIQKLEDDFESKRTIEEDFQKNENEMSLSNDWNKDEFELDSDDESEKVEIVESRAKETSAQVQKRSKQASSKTKNSDEDFRKIVKDAQEKKLNTLIEAIGEDNVKKILSLLMDLDSLPNSWERLKLQLSNYNPLNLCSNFQAQIKAISELEEDEKPLAILQYLKSEDFQKTPEYTELTRYGVPSASSFDIHLEKRIDSLLLNIPKANKIAMLDEIITCITSLIVIAIFVVTLILNPEVGSKLWTTLLIVGIGSGSGALAYSIFTGKFSFIKAIIKKIQSSKVQNKLKSS